MLAHAFEVLRLKPLLIVLTLLYSAPVGCGGPTAPEPVTALTIAPAVSALKALERVTFSASMNGSRTEVAWASSDPAVLAIDATGAATALTVGAASVSASAQGQTARVNLRVVSDYSGRWSGLMRRACIRISGPGPIACSPEATYRIALSLEQTGALVTGTIDLFREPTVGPVTGRVDERNHLVLQGSASNPEHQEVHRIEEWDTFLLEPGDYMAGRWLADGQWVNGFGMQHWKEEFTLLEVTRLR